ncbi:hypothetical protein ACFL50_03925 [Candidatus Latescibacterota bacterium]
MLERKDFVTSFNALLTGTGAFIKNSDLWTPKGYNSPEEFQLRDFEPFKKNWPVAHRVITEWWPKHPARSPVWDMVLTAKIGDKNGLILVEGKAHERELDRNGKNQDPDGSPESKQNHEKIGKNIAEARISLNRVKGGFAISRDTHYQQSNRVAFAWKLASKGIPNVLMYLGFLGDTFFPDFLQDNNHWQRVIGAYMDGVIPLSFPNRWIDCGTSKMFMAIRSLPIQAISI